jgi:hypothetical protein
MASPEFRAGAAVERENSMHGRILVAILVGLLIGVPGAPSGYAQAPVAGDGPPPPPLSAQQLEELVGRIALYPDDLVAIVLPASTFPLDIVQADRFLQKLKQDKNLKPDPRWDESIHNLLNYPEVVSMMSQDLDWTQGLGEAVVSHQADALKAIQAFRAKAASAGNLKTDDKQIIVQEQEVIKIVPADPEVIYVPQYQPSAVVVYQPAPVWGYYPYPYPSYYYPYPYGAGAAFATGFFFGAATAWACNWGGGHVENNVNINNTDNLNINRNDPQRQQKAQQAREQGRQRAQQPSVQNRQQGAGARGQGGGNQWQSQKRPGEVGQGRVSPRTSQARPGTGGASQRGEFGNPGRGSDAMRDANRGMQSRGGDIGGGGRGGAGASTMDRGGTSRGGGSVSTMDRGGSRGSGSGASMGGGGSRGGGGASMGGGGSRGGGGGGGGRRR